MCGVAVEFALTSNGNFGTLVEVFSSSLGTLAPYSTVQPGRFILAGTSSQGKASDLMLTNGFQLRILADVAVCSDVQHVQLMGVMLLDCSQASTSASL